MGYNVTPCLSSDLPQGDSFITDECAKCGGRIATAFEAHCLVPGVTGIGCEPCSNAPSACSDVPRSSLFHAAQGQRRRVAPCVLNDASAWRRRPRGRVKRGEHDVGFSSHLVSTGSHVHAAWSPAGPRSAGKYALAECKTTTISSTVNENARMGAHRSRRPACVVWF